MDSSGQRQIGRYEERWQKRVEVAAGTGGSGLLCCVLSHAPNQSKLLLLLGNWWVRNEG